MHPFAIAASAEASFCVQHHTSRVISNVAYTHAKFRIDHVALVFTGGAYLCRVTGSAIEQHVTAQAASRILEQVKSIRASLAARWVTNCVSTVFRDDTLSKLASYLIDELLCYIR